MSIVNAWQAFSSIKCFQWHLALACCDPTLCADASLLMFPKTENVRLMSRIIGRMFFYLIKGNSSKGIRKERRVFDLLLITCGCSYVCFFLFFRSSVVSACLPTPSLRNPLTCHAAMISAGDVGKGKSCSVQPEAERKFLIVQTSLTNACSLFLFFLF